MDPRNDYQRMRDAKATGRVSHLDDADVHDFVRFDRDVHVGAKLSPALALRLVVSSALFGYSAIHLLAVVT